MDAAQTRDLNYSTHLARNAVENYNFLVSRGLSHEAAVARVGYTPEGWIKMQDRARKAAEARARYARKRQAVDA